MNPTLPSYDLDPLSGASCGPGASRSAPGAGQAVSALPGDAPSRVLFLDIDGVVLHGKALWSTGDPRHLPEEKVALIREVCERSGCVIVVSSTWRYSDGTADLLRARGLTLHPDWRTSVKRDMVGSIIVGQQRGVEIGRWLARHPVGAYAIIDDDSDMLVEQMPYFIKTNFEEGIEPWMVDALVAILAPPSLTASP